MRWLPLALVALSLAGCQDDGSDITITIEAPDEVVVGEKVTIPISVKGEIPEDRKLYSCGDGLLKNNDHIVLTPQKAGETKLCVEGKYGKWKVGGEAITMAVFPEGKGPKEAKAKIEAWADGLAKGLADTTPEHSGRCQQKAIANQVYDASFVASLRGEGEPSALEPAFARIRPGWSATFSRALEGSPLPSKADDLDEIWRHLNLAWAIVLVPTKAQAPKGAEGVTAGGVVTIDEPGLFQGTANLIRIATGELICRWPLTVRSSKVVKKSIIREGGKVEDDYISSFDPAMQDFAQNTLTALRKSLPIHAPDVNFAAKAVYVEAGEKAKDL